MTHNHPNTYLGKRQWTRSTRLKPSRHRIQGFAHHPVVCRVTEESAVRYFKDRQELVTTPTTTLNVVHSLNHAVVVHVFTNVNVVKG